MQNFGFTLGFRNFTLSAKFKRYLRNQVYQNKNKNVLGKSNTVQEDEVFHWLKKSLHKKWGFSSRISSVNLTKSRVSYGSGHIYWRSPWWKTSFFVQSLSCKCDAFSLAHHLGLPGLTIPWLETWKCTNNV